MPNSDRILVLVPDSFNNGFDKPFYTEDEYLNTNGIDDLTYNEKMELVGKNRYHYATFLSGNMYFVPNAPDPESADVISAAAFNERINHLIDVYEQQNRIRN